MSDAEVAANRRAWDARTPAHVASPFYGVESFVAGGCSLHPPELALLPDVVGCDMLHLQCHFGLDTLSWARRGARVTGMDFSSASIDEAKKLQRRSGLDAQFVVGDVTATDWPVFARAYDVVYTSYGVLYWLPDLSAWGDGIARALRPGGRFVLVEFHPALELIFPGKISGSHTYFHRDEPCSEFRQGTYADRDTKNILLQHRWQHSLADVLGSLLCAGLRLEELQEYSTTPCKLYPGLDARGTLGWYASAHPNKLPYTFSVVARK